MAGLFDLHLSLLVQDGWRTRAASAVLFRDLFARELELGQLTTAQTDEWWGLLAPAGDTHYLAFTPAYNMQLAKKLQVVVTMSDEPDDQDYLGDTGDNENQAAMVLKETVMLTCYAENKGLLRALHVALRAVIMASKLRLISLGYDSIRYVSGGDIRGEDMGLPSTVFVRHQTWEAVIEERINTVRTSPLKNWFVASVDATVGSHLGGVSPMGV